MTAGELQVINVKREEIRRLKRRLDVVKDGLARLTAIVDGMPKCHKLISVIEEMTVEKLELEMKLQTLTVEMEMALQLLSVQFERALDGAAQKVMLERYGYGRRFKEIARRLNYSERRVYQIHAGALKKIAVAIQ